MCRLSQLCLYVLCVVPIAAADGQQGSGSSRSDPVRITRPQTPDEFYNTFWQHLVKKDAGYNTWTGLPQEKVDDTVENPHGTVSKTFANKIAADDPKKLPVGSILVREDYDELRKRLSISVMYRVKDYDKEHADWYWLKYQTNGSIVRGADQKAVAGKVASCIACHGKATGQDFVFANDRPHTAKPADQPSGTKTPKE